MTTSERGFAPQGSEPGDQLAQGTVLGEYVIEGWAAAGGMATVYSAKHPTIGKRAAVKVMNGSLTSDAVCVERFVQEARAAGQLRSPNIVEVFGFGTLPDGRKYSIMEWLEGETLGRRMSRGDLTIQEGCDILIQVCDALSATHEHGIIHRDLKPENLFLSAVQGGRLVVKLLDFGIAKLLQPVSEKSRARLTAEHSTIGTAEYLSPEQATGRAILPPSDLYSLGVVMYEMFVGRLPFEGQSPVEIMYQHIHNLPPEPSSFGVKLPALLEQLVFSLLDKDPSRRPELPSVRTTLLALRDRGEQVPTVDEVPICEGPTASPEAPMVLYSAPAVAQPFPLTPPATATLEDDGDLPRPATHTMRRRKPTRFGRLPMLGFGLGGLLLFLYFGTGREVRIAESSRVVSVARATPVVSVPPLGLTPAAKPGTLAISTNVHNARFVLDNHVVATGADAAQLTIADSELHTLEVSAPGRKPIVQRFSVPAGETVDLNVKLVRLNRLPRATTTMRRTSYIIDSAGKVR